MSCGECNRRKLDNYDDEIGIINPYETDPENHLFATGAIIFPRLGDSIGKLAYELFELNRIELLERRNEKLTNLQIQLDRFATETNETLKKLYKRQIEKAKENHNEYAMVTKAFIKLAMNKCSKP